MTVGQCCCSLQGYAAEQVDVAAEMEVAQRAALKILHQFVVAVLALDVGFAKVIDFDNHLEVERAYHQEQLLVDVEVGIVHLQHEVPTLFVLDEEYLRFSRGVAQALFVQILMALDIEVFLRLFDTLGSLSHTSDGAHSGVIDKGPVFWGFFFDGSVNSHYLSSFISPLVFFPKITHLPPRWGLAQPQGLECIACFQLHTQASLTPAGFCAIA